MQVIISQLYYQSRFTVRCLSEADDCGFGGGSAGGCCGSSGERRAQHHGGEGCGGCSCCGAGLRQQTLLDEGFWVWGHLTQRRETSLETDRGRKREQVAAWNGMKHAASVIMDNNRRGNPTNTTMWNYGLYNLYPPGQAGNDVYQDDSL